MLCINGQVDRDTRIRIGKGEREKAQTSCYSFYLASLSAGLPLYRAPMLEEESGGGYSADLTQFHREDSLKDTA